MAIERVPDDVIVDVLLYLPPHDILHCFQLLSRRYHQIARDPFVWKHHCLERFRYWNRYRALDEKLAGPVSAVDWRALLLDRLAINRTAGTLLDDVISSSSGRSARLNSLCSFGYDINDLMLAENQAPDHADDVLARRYFSAIALGAIHRARTTEEWHDMRFAPEVTFDLLERALGTLDRRLRYAVVKNWDDNFLSSTIDALLVAFVDGHPNHHHWNKREKVMALNVWISSQSLTFPGGNGDRTPGRRCCLAGLPLSDNPSAALASQPPFLVCALLCCLARRLDLSAEFYNSKIVPAGSLDVVIIDTGSDSDTSPDGEPIRPHMAHVQRYMFFNPLHPDMVLPASLLLSPRSTDPLPADRPGHLLEGLLESWLMAMLRTNACGCGSAKLYRHIYYWLLCISSDRFLPDLAHRALKDCEVHWPEDMWTYKQFVAPVIHDQAIRCLPTYPIPHPHTLSLARHFDSGLAALDAHGPPMLRTARTGSVGLPPVHYRVGQIVRHAFDSVVGVINGWAVDNRYYSPATALSPSRREPPAALSRPQWAFRVDEVSWRETDRVFYAILTQSGDRVWRQENVEIVQDDAAIDEVQQIDRLGNYFRRFDSESRSFVSNMRDIYPDD